VLKDVTPQLTVREAAKSVGFVGTQLGQVGDYGEEQADRHYETDERGDRIRNGAANFGVV
jgi:hypothetical protein